MSIQTERVYTGAFSMDFFRFGSGGRTMVIMPGLSVQSVMGSAEAVADGYRLFADEFTVYVFDRRNELPPAYTVPDIARDTAEAMDALGLRDVYLFGASQGGMAAMVLAAERPGLVRRMALGSAAVRMTEERFGALEQWIRTAKTGDGVGLYLSFGEKLYPKGTFAAFRDALISAGRTVTAAELERFIVLAEGTRGFNASDLSAMIRCPVLVLGAEDDAVLGPDAAPEIAEKLRPGTDIELCMYSGYGHAAFDTAPDYRQRIYRFFMQTAHDGAAERYK